MTTFIGRATCVLALVLVSSGVEARHHSAKRAAHAQRQASHSRASRPTSTKNAQAKVDPKANDLSGLPGF